MIAWGRRIQLLGALTLIVAPFFGWAEVEIFDSAIGVPGLLLHGSILLALGLVVSTAILVGARLPGFHALATVAAGAVTAWDLSRILARTEYFMGRVQLSLADLNHMLARLNVTPIEVFDRAASPWQYVGSGVWVGVAGTALLGVGVLLELLGYRGEGKTALSVLFGMPRCAACGFSVRHGMRFCPGCGQLLAGERPCRACGAPLARGYTFCPDCGQNSSAGA